MSPRRIVEQELSRERILSEARDLFAEHGYHSLTMRKIAKEMGYSHGALYYHYRDKAELFYALVEEDFKALLGRMQDMLARIRVNDLNQLKRLMIAFIEFGLDNPHHYEIMFLINDADLRRYSRTEQALCLDLFASLVRGVIKGRPGADKKMYTLPWSLFMSLHGFISYSVRYRQTYEEVKQLAEAHVNYLCEAL